VSDFPVQPSRRDGLGTMCREHWTLYTRALRRARTKGVLPEPVPVPVEVPVRVRRARATIAATDTLAGEAYTAAVASDEVQEALATLAGHGEDAVP